MVGSDDARLPVLPVCPVLPLGRGSPQLPPSGSRKRLRLRPVLPANPAVSRPYHARDPVGVAPSRAWTSQHGRMSPEGKLGLADGVSSALRPGSTGARPGWKRTDVGPAAVRPVWSGPLEAAYPALWTEGVPRTPGPSGCGSAAANLPLHGNDSRPERGRVAGEHLAGTPEPPFTDSEGLEDQGASGLVDPHTVFQKRTSSRGADRAPVPIVTARCPGPEAHRSHRVVGPSIRLVGTTRIGPSPPSMAAGPGRLPPSG